MGADNAAGVSSEPAAGGGGSQEPGGGAGGPENGGSAGADSAPTKGDDGVDGDAPEVKPDGVPSACPAAPTLSEESTSRTQVTVDLRFGMQALTFGEPNELAEAGTVMPTNLRFYLSQFEVLRGEERVAATLLDGAGEPAPYGVQLVNAEAPESLTFALAAPPGDYDGLAFLFGLSTACNALLGPAGPPLDEASQLKWPHSLGFLFLRFEGQVSSDAAPAVPALIHMGAAVGEKGGAPWIFVRAPSGSAGDAIELELPVDGLLDAAMTETDLSDFKLLDPLTQVGPETEAGERLRRAAEGGDLFRWLP